MAHVVDATASLIERLRTYYNGKPLASDWFTVEQDVMNQFSEAINDPDWMHIDVERAKRDGPYDGTVAFGFWTVSMITYFSRQVLGGEYPEGVLYGFNYGFDRVRFMAPVPIGKRIRDHVRLLDIQDKGGGRILSRTEHRIEVEGEEKPAMIAEWLGMFVVDPDYRS